MYCLTIFCVNIFSPIRGQTRGGGEGGIQENLRSRHPFSWLNNGFFTDIIFRNTSKGKCCTNFSVTRAPFQICSCRNEFAIYLSLYSSASSCLFGVSPLLSCTQQSTLQFVFPDFIPVVIPQFSNFSQMLWYVLGIRSGSFLLAICLRLEGTGE